MPADTSEINLTGILGVFCVIAVSKKKIWQQIRMKCNKNLWIF